MSKKIEREIVMFDIKKRNELIEKIIDLLEAEEMSQVECYGILEHCKSVIFFDSIRETLIETFKEINDDEDEE
jgi:hypothetical protein